MPSSPCPGAPWRANSATYVSGGGTDSSEQGRSRWARVKGRTENAVIKTFPNGYALRPGFVQPLHGKQSKTKAHRLATRALPVIAVLARLLRLTPVLMTSTKQLGQVALELANRGHSRRVLENRDIVSVAVAAQRTGERPERQER
ncbi:hypothetical protein AB0B66_38480 [Catellatospora sp. NPDC049111]|uniref:hypothetical protein n=1 Tax=Catellatospora sp. NPDC049111 TaxID=3155271 RepID=UPI0033C80B02